MIYLAVLIAMLIPLYLLGQPAGGGTGDAGGQLTQMRTRYNIAESELGDISPASATMKLASLGLRGPAAALLWNKAHDYKVRHQWDRLKATVNTLSLLQPHYEKVWEFQAHNLSYNVSSEFDDYRQRYSMVREGIEYLTRGVEQNRKAPRLVWYTGWFYGQKIGMSDEKRQFRRLFSDDDPQHQALREQNIPIDSPDARGPDGKPDNWLVGRQWLDYGYDLVDGGVKIRNQTPLNFFETGPKWRIKHAEAIESEGVLDDRAKSAWQLAGDGWKTFGQRSIQTTAAFSISIEALDDLKQRRDNALSDFMEVAGETFRLQESEIRDGLSDAEKVALETAEEDRTEDQMKLVANLYDRLTPKLANVARKAPGAVRLRAIELSAEIAALEARITKAQGHRNQTNYDYWTTLTKAEQEDRTVQARRLLFEAEQANADADIDLAIAKYEESFELWAQIFDDYQVLLFDDLSDDLMRSIRRYTIAIDSDTFDDDFPLAAFAEVMGRETKETGDYERVRAEQLQRLKAKKEAENKAAENPIEEKEKADEPKVVDPKPESPPADESKSDDKPKEEPKPVEPNDQTPQAEEAKPAEPSAESADPS
ncbi:MAG TPA: IRE (iron responsive element) [Planctomycetaceae bacterium]|nr:IRE (iron responsive element) [Planctomycetaceae bacterium]